MGKSCRLNPIFRKIHNAEALMSFNIVGKSELQIAPSLLLHFIIDRQQ